MSKKELPIQDERELHWDQDPEAIAADILTHLSRIRENRGDCRIRYEIEVVKDDA